MNANVADLIQKRAAQNSSPGKRSDNAKIGLIIEGGGMRGVVSGGMVSGLEMLGLLNCFDAVYGSSAGAINGAYFLAKQAIYGTTIYYENINNVSFINEKNLISSEKPILSLEFLLDHVCEFEKPLDWHAILESNIPLVAVASSVKNGRAEYLKGFRTKSELKEALRASARIPIVSGPPVKWRENEYWDALIYEPVPIFAAIQDGCTHVVALLTRPWGKTVVTRGFVDKHVFARKVKALFPHIAHHYNKRDQGYSSIVDQIYSGQFEHEGKTVQVLPIATAKSCKQVESNEKNRMILAQGGIDGARAVFEAFGMKGVQFVESILPYVRGARFDGENLSWRTVATDSVEGARGNGPTQSYTKVSSV